MRLQSEVLTMQSVLLRLTKSLDGLSTLRKDFQAVVDMQREDYNCVKKRSRDEGPVVDDPLGNLSS